MADPALSLKQRALVTDAARALDKAKMMRFDEKSGNFYCTELGRIASHFYIQYTSVETYNEMLKRHMSDSEVGLIIVGIITTMLSKPINCPYFYYFLNLITAVLWCCISFLLESLVLQLCNKLS